ncbi:uncharacterized protein LOC144655898 [Oculina patagonica]
MSCRVTPNEASLSGDHEMPSSNSVLPSTNDVPMADDAISDQENVNEQLLKDVDEVYSPVLRLMKMFGTYFGDTNLNRLTHASGGCKKWVYCQRIYCGLVVSGFWLHFIMSFVDVFVANNIYLYLMFSLWCLLIALSGTISLVVLCVPLADMGRSRFQNFLGSLIAIESSVNLEKLKSKSKKGIIIVCFFIVIGIVGIVAYQLLLGESIAAFKPWHQWFGIRILALIFSIYGMGVWLLPVLFFCLTCLILEELFDDLYKRMSSFRSVSVNIETFKMEHQKLCEVVELADKMFSSLLFEVISLYIPLICLNFYKAVNLPQAHGKLVLLVNDLFWLTTAAFILAMIMFFGSKLCEKIMIFPKILQTCLVSNEDEGKVFTAIQLVMFMLDLQDNPKGLSIGGLVVITKSLSLTFLGLIVSYFAVMLSLPK